MQLWDLERAVRMLRIDDPRVLPAGPMVTYVGAQLTLDEITKAYGALKDGLEIADPAVLLSIRSFPVLPLVGVEVVCSPIEFDAQVKVLFSRYLPDLPASPVLGNRVGPIWRRPTGLVEKYHLLDGAYVAPPDDATQQTMVIELGGHVSGSEGRLERGAPFPEIVVVTITHAHWANVAGLGIAVGFYE